MAAERDALTEAFKCQLCFTNEVNRLFVPCGHLVCDDCGDQLRNRKCPFCRNTFSNICPFYKPG